MLEDDLKSIEPNHFDAIKKCVHGETESICEIMNCKCICMHVYICLNVCLCTYICVYVCMHVCVHVCMYA
jgi:hypothetical protein